MGVARRHRRRSSVNFWGKDILCPKIYVWKLTKCPNFIWHLHEKYAKKYFSPEFWGPLGANAPVPPAPTPMPEGVLGSWNTSATKIFCISDGSSWNCYLSTYLTHDPLTHLPALLCTECLTCDVWHERVMTQSCSPRRSRACLRSAVPCHRTIHSVTRTMAITTDVWLKPAGLTILRPSTSPSILLTYLLWWVPRLCSDIFVTKNIYKL